MARDLGDELDQLRQLRDSGALSNEEYRRAKAALQGDSAPDSDPEETVPRSTRSKVRSGKAPGKRTSTKGLYRDADKLVIREGATLPDRCVICNKESDGEPMDFTFGRLKMHYIELAAAQTVANAAVDLVKGTKYTGPVQAAIPLCSWHRKRRLRRIGIGLGIMALAAAVLLYRYSIAGADEFSVFRISIYSIIAVVAALVGIAIICPACLMHRGCGSGPPNTTTASSGSRAPGGNISAHCQ